MWTFERGRPRLIGMVHLLPLPGAPSPASWSQLLSRAVADAQAWARGGADAVLIENFGDSPFAPAEVAPITIASMARAIAAVRAAIDLPLGVNVLRNDAAAALALATAFELDFVRINVHSGVAVADQGLITGRADQTLRERAALRSRVKLFADLRVKHARPLAERPLVDEAHDLFERAHADALLITGPATGRAPDLAPLVELAAALPRCPFLLASGATPKLVAEGRALLSGCIVGSAAKRGGRLAAPVDVARVRALAAACRGR